MPEQQKQCMERIAESLAKVPPEQAEFAASHLATMADGMAIAYQSMAKEASHQSEDESKAG